MNKFSGSEIASETGRLLSALDDAIDQSAVMRDIVDRYRRLHYLESLTGPSRTTVLLRQEIIMMERKFRLGRDGSSLEPAGNVSPAQ